MRKSPNTRRESPARSHPAKIDCPYCGAGASFLPSSESVYHGRDYGPLYVCFPCEAWVGCHRGTARPLGRLADAELRRAKRDAHDAFDPAWRELHATRCSADATFTSARARASAYKLLAHLLEIDPASCHIGMFDVGTCRRVVALCAAGALAPDRFPTPRTTR